MTFVPIHFSHIQKTGGTSLLYHFRMNYGDDKVFVFGPDSRRTRFFKGLFQLEECSVEEKRSIRVLQGHGVDQTSLALAENGRVQLLIVLRHPVAHLQSFYNQFFQGRSARGFSVTPKMFLDEIPSDFISNSIIKKYPAFVEPGAQTLLEKARSVLQKFDQVYVTERLDEQAAILMQSLDLPEVMERRRVTAKNNDLQLDSEEILARSPADWELFKEANCEAPNEERCNPFGFDKTGRERCVEHILIPSEHSQSNCYQELADALCVDLRAEEAMVYLGQDRTAPVQQPELFLSILKGSWEQHLKTLGPDQMEISKARAKT